jgi:serine/threonine protein kinase
MVMSEVSNLRGLRGCRNIIQLEEVYSTRNNMYIITELCEDGDLVRLIEERNCNE